MSTPADGTVAAPAPSAVDAAAPGNASDATVGERPVWLVIGPEPLTASLEPLVRRRKAQGFEVAVLPMEPAAAVAAAPRPPAFVLLVGDDPGDGDDEAGEPWVVRSPRRELYRWQSDQAERFASDALLGDLDGDLVPDVPVGRIPSRTPEEAAAVVAKIAAWEDRPPSVADLRLVAWGGSPDYGPGVDRILSRAALALVETSTPPWACPRSPCSSP